MQFAYSIYWGGTIIDAEQCDYTSSRELGLHCPFCNEAVFWRTAHTRTMPDGSTQHVDPSFVHYPGLGIDCELRAKRPEGEAYIHALEVKARNQRLILFNKYFIDIIRKQEIIEDESSKVKIARKLMGKDCTKPLIELFRQQKIKFDFIKNEANKNLKRMRYISQGKLFSEVIREEFKNTAERIDSYITQKNLTIAYEAALWLQSKSANWALDRTILLCMISLCEFFAVANQEECNRQATEKYIKIAYQHLKKYPELLSKFISMLLVSINWKNIESISISKK